MEYLGPRGLFGSGRPAARADHARLRKKCGGPPTDAVATAQQVQDRIEAIRKWAQTRR